MLHDTMSHAGLSAYTEIAMVLVLALFAAILAYLFVWRKKGYWQAHGQLPLHDGDRPADGDRDPASRRAP